jgi:hypothetical protein
LQTSSPRATAAKLVHAQRRDMEGSESPNDVESLNANEKRIALWPARNREVGDSHPYLTGRLTIDGKKYLVTLWQRERTSDRQPILSGHVEQEVELEV